MGIRWQEVVTGARSLPLSRALKSWLARWGRNVSHYILLLRVRSFLLKNLPGSWKKMRTHRQMMTEARRAERDFACWRA